MEFPHLGQHCSESSCNRLDFLPVKCDSCSKVFCASHFNYERHSCPGAYKKNVQVPICPLCGEPVPTAPGVEPDLTVGQHIDKQCKSDSRKIYTNRCNAKGCKRKELIPVQCSQCKLNFCLGHRHTSDHDCQGPVLPTNTRSITALAAERRQNKSTNPKPRQVPVTTTQRSATSTSQVQNIQGNMSEDEALARALALSMMEQENQNHPNPTPPVQGQRVRVGGNDAQNTNNKDKCLLS